MKKKYPSENIVEVADLHGVPIFFDDMCEHCVRFVDGKCAGYEKFRIDNDGLIDGTLTYKWVMRCKNWLPSGICRTTTRRNGKEICIERFKYDIYGNEIVVWRRRRPLPKEK